MPFLLTSQTTHQSNRNCPRQQSEARAGCNDNHICLFVLPMRLCKVIRCLLHERKTYMVDSKRSLEASFISFIFYIPLSTSLKRLYTGTLCVHMGMVRSLFFLPYISLHLFTAFKHAPQYFVDTYFFFFLNRSGVYNCATF